MAHLGLRLLVVVLVAGAVACIGTLVSVSTPGNGLDGVWQVQPRAAAAFDAMGAWGVLLATIFGAMMFISAIGLGARATWSSPLAAAVLSLGVAAGVVAAAASQQASGLIVLPIGGAMVHFLMSEAVRAQLIEPPEEV